MKNKIGLIVVLTLFVIIVGGVAYVLLSNNKTRGNNNTVNNTENTIESTTTNKIVNESEEEMKITLKISINNKTYEANLEQNETVKRFLEILPKEFNMSELNGNEKYVYLDNALPTNSYSPNHIEAGDIMLYGNNCLVIFYKSFDTPYSYTKIGHIQNFEDLGNKNVTIKFE